MNSRFDFFSSGLLGPRDLAWGSRAADAKREAPAGTDPEYRFTVIPGLGEGGKAAKLPERLKPQAEEAFNNHSFNVILSDHISLDRHLQDVRGPK